MIKLIPNLPTLSITIMSVVLAIGSILESSATLPSIFANREFLNTFKSTITFSFVCFMSSLLIPLINPMEFEIPLGPIKIYVSEGGPYFLINCFFFLTVVVFWNLTRMTLIFFDEEIDRQRNNILNTK
jgi:hypothetical protein